MLSDVPALLAAVTAISNSAGTLVDLTNVEEVRIGTGLAATRVTGSGAPYVLIEIPTSPAPDTAPLPARTAQHPIAAGDDQYVLIVVSADSKPVLISQLDFFPAGAVTANAVNYVSITLLETDGNGAVAGITSGSPTSFSTAAVSWQAGKIAFTWPGQYDLAAGHGILASIVNEGAGAPLPSGVWRII